MLNRFAAIRKARVATDVKLVPGFMLLPVKAARNHSYSPERSEAFPEFVVPVSASRFADHRLHRCVGPNCFGI